MNNYKYPTVEEALKYSDLITFSDASHSVFTINFGDIKLVYKSLTDINFPKKTKKILKKIEQPLNNYYASKVHFMAHIDEIHDTFDIEKKILDYWSKKSIPSITILEKQDKALIFKYFDAENFDKILQKEDDKSPKYKQMLDVITTIRDVAKSENNPLYLYPDLLPKNFLYVFETEKTIAIDPGLKLKDMPFEELDARINLSFLYHINKFKSGDGYITSFLERLPKEDIKNIREVNHPLRNDVAAYLNIRNNIVTLMKGLYHNNYSGPGLHVFSPSNTIHINDLLDKHI